jgi:hypothetical protein
MSVRASLDRVDARVRVAGSALAITDFVSRTLDARRATCA